MKAGFKKNKKVQSGQSPFLLILLGILLLVIVGFLINTNLKINRQRTKLLSQIETLSSEVKILEEKKREMTERVSQATSKEYLEKVARDQLGFKKPGEEVVAITKENENEEKKEEKQEKSFLGLKKLWDWIRGK